MSQNFTEIVKVRVSHEMKSDWEKQAAAKTEETGERVTVSDLVRERMNEYTVQPAVVVLDPAQSSFPTKLNPPSETEPYDYEFSISEEEVTYSRISNVTAAEDEVPIVVPQWVDLSAAEDVPTSEQAGSVEERRSETCAHQRPAYIFCPECDQ